MREIIEIYLKDRSFNNEKEIQNTIKEIMQSDDGFSFEVIARYVCNVDGRNILVEIQVPTLFSVNCGHREIEMVAYTFSGNMEDFNAEREIETRVFDEQWDTAIEQMKRFASEV